MSTRISSLVTEANPQTNILLPCLVSGVTRKVTLNSVLNSVTGGTVIAANVTGGTGISVAIEGVSQAKSITVSFNVPGLIVPFAGAATTEPSGWLFCNGQAVLRSGTLGYPNLFAVIGTTYGNGDGTTTFNVPDLRGRIPFGVAQNSSTTSPLNGVTFSAGNFYALASSGGQENHLITAAQTPVKDHTHSASGSMTVYGEYGDTQNWDDPDVVPPENYTDYGHLGEIAPGTQKTISSTASSSALTSVNAALPHSNMPPAIVLSYLVKT
jgi:microcystin-dependent protein